jgi:hypothetical protein
MGGSRRGRPWAGAAAALALLLAGPARAGDDGGTRGADGGAPDADERVIEHLDELQQLELIENLGLLDPIGDEEPSPPAEAPPPSRTR